MTNSQLFLDWHCAIADISDQWASVDWGSEPAPPFAQRSAQCLLFVRLSCHTQKLACPKPRTSLLPSLWSCCPRSAHLVPSSISTALAAHNIDPPNCHNWTALTHTAPFAHNWKMHLIHPLRASAHAAATSKVYLLIACACSARCLSNTLLFALCAVAAATLIALHIWPSTLCRLLYLSQTAYYQHKFRRCVRERYVCHGYGPYGIKVSAEIWPSVHRDTPLSSPSVCQLQTISMHPMDYPTMIYQMAGTTREPRCGRKLWSCCR